MDNIDKYIKYKRKYLNLKLKIMQGGAGFTDLLKQIDYTFDKVNSQLDTGRKTSHWMWYYFPTEKPGISDPYKTFVNRQNAIELSKKSEFINIHKKIYNLLKSGLAVNDIFPPIDLDRINYFVKFWRNVPGFTEIDGLEGYLDALEG
jgi:hypothetical protein